MISRQLLLSPLLFASCSSNGAASAAAASPLDVSNATNSMSPDDLKSRIFIGNLANAVTKRALHSVFTAYGQIKAISLHKGMYYLSYFALLSINSLVFPFAPPYPRIRIHTVFR